MGVTVVHEARRATPSAAAVSAPSFWTPVWLVPIPEYIILN
jgi:hypothetical protein